jgi:hypothetical protein
MKNACKPGGVHIRAIFPAILELTVPDPALRNSLPERGKHFSGLEPRFDYSMIFTE